MAAKITPAQLEDLQERKAALIKEFLASEPPDGTGEKLIELWEQIYDEDMQKTVVKTESGPSSDENPVMPYEKIAAAVGIGPPPGEWKWHRIWQAFDEIERRGPAYRDGEALNFGMPNKNPGIYQQKVLVVGGGPIGIRMAIELVMGGHKVTLVEKRREVRDDAGNLKSLGFTNRINRPHMWPFVRNDLQKLNGKNILSTKAAYPVFTEPDTMSIGIDEIQLLLLKNALFLGVDIRLGVGYENAKIKIDDDSMNPSWTVSLKYDAKAAAKYGKEEGVSTEEFDCLVGCDGPRSTVRDTQKAHFGNVEKRKFMDCVGIVSNVQKVTRKRLKELGFESGLEPGDMNRTKMVFKEFFGKIQEEADADIENLIYYKASNHNYTILVPKRADMIKHGLSGKVYTFAEGRDGKGQMAEEKEKLKNYCRKVLTAAGIPIDPDLSNGGFVGVPNDCMAFDFAECWNTKQSHKFNLPPPGYSVEEDGDWEGKRLIPYIALAGDSLLEPFWPMGLGLKRGWQAIMDTNYAIDNLWNNEHFAQKFLEEKGHAWDDEEDPMDWDYHMDSLREATEQNFEFCNRLQVSEELALGEYEDKSLIMTALKKRIKDPEKPLLLIEVDPKTRYKALADVVSAGLRKMTKEEAANFIHPVAQRALNKKKWMDDITQNGKVDFEFKSKELVSINGKVVGGFKQAGKTGGAKKPIKAKAKSRRAPAEAAAAEAAADGE